MARAAKRRATKQVVTVVADDDDDVVVTARASQRARKGEAAPSAASSKREQREYLKKVDAAATEAAEAAYTGRRISAEEIEKLVGEVMRHMLFKHAQNPSQPISRSELMVTVSTKYPDQSRKGLPHVIIRKAMARFCSTFGYEMRELGTEGASNRWYVLRSMLPEWIRDKVSHTTEELKDQQGLTLLILMLISMGGEQVTEDKLWEYLNVMGLEKKEKHVTFGDVEAVISKLVKKRYIQRTLQNSANGRVTVYRLGDNATDEITQDKLSSAVSKMLQGAPGVEETIELSE